MEEPPSCVSSGTALSRRQYEQAWLDDAIPELAGHTPREAAADPTRRPDLIRLLDSFPREQDRPGLMNPDRLRVELGLH